MIIQLSPYDIRCDGGTQLRAFPNETITTEYKEAMLQGDQFPPVVVFKDADGNRWCADGFHRIRAAKDGGIALIDVDEREGTLRDAILYAAGANSAHGLKRNSSDKRRAINVLLDDEEWGQRSDNWIAEVCGVHDGVVASERAIHPKFKVPDSGTLKRRGKDGKSYPAKKARLERKAPPTPKDESGAGASSSPQNRSSDELRVSDEPPNEPGNQEQPDASLLHLDHQSAKSPASECPSQETGESNGNEQNNSKPSPASFETPLDLCRFLGENEAAFAWGWEWLAEEARRLSEN
ncbi:hypothetical protein IAD21_00880 [Abditibacteriota bacterium]|nr:hypothetical protein IAD21_00880 [Abditibacteriota bacterium]